MGTLAELDCMSVHVSGITDSSSRVSDASSRTHCAADGRSDTSSAQQRCSKPNISLGQPSSACARSGRRSASGLSSSHCSRCTSSVSPSCNSRWLGLKRLDTLSSTSGWAMPSNGNALATTSKPVTASAKMSLLAVNRPANVSGAFQPMVPAIPFPACEVPSFVATDIIVSAKPKSAIIATVRSASRSSTLAALRSR